MLPLDTYWLPLIKEEFPEFKLVAKQDSSFMKTLDTLLRIVSFGKMKAFMQYTTTIGYTVYTTTEWDRFSERTKIEILRHERVHMRQRARYDFWFYLLYLLLPIPVLFAYYRTKFEQEAYAESMRCVAEERGIKPLMDPKYRERMVNQFTGPQYLWMWVSRSAVERWYDRTVIELRLEFEGVRFT